MFILVYELNHLSFQPHYYFTPLLHVIPDLDRTNEYIYTQQPGQQPASMQFAHFL